MKKSMKTIVGAGLALCLSLASLAGCSNQGGNASTAASSEAPKKAAVHADDFVNSIYKGMLTGDASEARANGADEVLATALETANKNLDTVKDQILSNPNVSRFKEYIPDSAVEEFRLGFKTAVANLPFTAETLTDNGDSAEVTVKVKPLVIKTYATAADAEAQAKVDINKLKAGDPDAIREYFTQYFTILGKKTAANEKPGTQKTIRVKLNKSGDTWTINNMSTTLNNLANAIATN